MSCCISHCSDLAGLSGLEVNGNCSKYLHVYIYIIAWIQPQGTECHFRVCVLQKTFHLRSKNVKYDVDIFREADAQGFLFVCFRMQIDLMSPLATDSKSK